MIIIVVVILTLSIRRRRQKTIELEELNLRIEQLKLQIENAANDVLETNEELITSKEQLEEINNEKDMLLNMVSHDLKSPMRRINMLADVLKMDSLDNEQLDCTQRINDISKQGLNLIQDLLDANTIAAQSHSLDYTDVNLNKLIQEKKMNFSNAAASKKGLQIDIDDNLDFDQQNEVAQQLLDDKVIEHDKKLAEGQTVEGEEVAENDSITSDMPEEVISAMFDDLYAKDEVLQQMLGGTSDYDLQEKLSILQAYKKGGGVAGLADIIDESEDDEGVQQQQQMK